MLHVIALSLANIGNSYDMLINTRSYQYFMMVEEKHTQMLPKNAQSCEFGIYTI